MGILIENKGLSGRFKISGNSTGGFKAIYSSVDADAQAFFNRVTTAGGALSVTEQIAVNTLVRSLKSAGIWTAMKAIYPMVGASAAACAQNLKSSSYTGNFSGTWTFASTGVLGNGTNTYMNTGVIPSIDLLQNDVHLSVYSRTNQTGGSTVDIGCFQSVRFYIILNYTNTTYLSVNTTSDNAVTTITDTRGFFEVSRTSSTLTKMYKNNAIHATTTEISSGINTTYPVYLGAYNNANTPSFYSTKEFSFSSIGNGLNDTQSANFYTAVQAFQTTLGRQV